MFPAAINKKEITDG